VTQNVSTEVLVEDKLGRQLSKGGSLARAVAREPLLCPGSSDERSGALRKERRSQCQRLSAALTPSLNGPARLDGPRKRKNILEK